MAPPEFICANWDPAGGDCEKNAKYSCKNCLLVVVSPITSSSCALLPLSAAPEPAQMLLFVRSPWLTDPSRVH